MTSSPAERSALNSKNDEMRLLMLSGGMPNPLAAAWQFTLARACAQTATLDFPPTPASPELYNAWGASASTYTNPQLGPPDKQTSFAIREQLRGDPTHLIAWWGTGSIRYLNWAAVEFPKTKRVLIVDTFPNASHLLSEIRERLVLRRQFHTVDGLIYTSATMRAMYEHAAPQLATLPSWTGPQPFPLAAHSSSGRRHPEYQDLIFTGRSDYLFSKSRRMAKDALGEQLLLFKRAGASVVVAGTQASTPNLTHSSKTPEPFSQYPRYTNREILDGQFSDMVSKYSAQVVTYNVPNRTVQRRIRASLSTRFALGICSPTPILVDRRSTFAVEWLRDNPIGVSYEPSSSGVAAALDQLNDQQDQMRDSWSKLHHSWTSEAAAPHIRALLRDVDDA